MGCSTQEFNKKSFIENKEGNENINDILLSVASIDSVDMEGDNEDGQDKDVDVSVDNELTGEENMSVDGDDDVAEV
jgi:hypothetical protein